MKNHTSLDQLMQKSLQNPETKKAYDELESEFAQIAQELSKPALNTTK